MAIEPPVVLFDGRCGLCDFWVNFLMARDHRARFRFATLQGSTADALLPGGAQEQPDSVMLWDGTSFYDRSDAIWRMLVELPGIWKVAGYCLRVIPRFIRNPGYKFIARHRYRIFGKKETCRIPTLAERARFLS